MEPFGNSSELVNWDFVLADLKIEPYLDLFELENPKSIDSFRIKWSRKILGFYFYEDVKDKFSKITNTIPYDMYFTRMNPGSIVSINFENIHVEKKYKRFLCFVKYYSFGQTFLLDNTLLHDISKHTIYEWPNFETNHAASNSGVEPFYLFHYLGTENDS